MSRVKLVDVNDSYACCVNVGCQGKSGPGEIHEVILVCCIADKLLLNNYVTKLLLKPIFRIFGIFSFSLIKRYGYM